MWPSTGQYKQIPALSAAAAGFVFCSSQFYSEVEKRISNSQKVCGEEREKSGKVGLMTIAVHAFCIYTQYRSL